MIQHILDFTEQELEDYMSEIDQPRYRANQIYKGIYSKNWQDFIEFSTLPKSFRELLRNQFSLRTFSLIDEIKSKKDGTTKYLWKLSDGMKIESVIIYEGKRVTFCISSQIGCPLDCKFCATGKMGLLRNLTSGEIIEQVIQMKERSLYPPTNIVFMGMGEPMLNYDAVIKSADIMSDPEGMAFSRKRITISTSGIIPAIYRMADENQPYSLAISLNSVKDIIREQIMPISKKYPLEKLLDAARYYNQNTKKRVTFEYVLIDGLNSSEEDAQLLVQLTQGITCKINIIPCNSDDPQFKPPTDEQIKRFDILVNDNHRTITIRRRKGWEIQAACGQLYAENERKKRISVKSLNI
ncbi:MAG: 23S rRNA (adenine(2503)-C(2))-methyltransferase RlmN [Calditrichaceae bacterium]